MTYIICRTTPLTSRRCILYIYSTNISTEYFKHAAHSPFFPSSNCRLFHNATFFGSCIIHILNTGCAKFKRKFRRLKVKTKTDSITKVQCLNILSFYLLTVWQNRMERDAVVTACTSFRGQSLLGCYATLTGKLLMFMKDHSAFICRARHFSRTAWPWGWSHCDLNNKSVNYWSIHVVLAA
jgi:hypothetical protein